MLFRMSALDQIFGGEVDLAFRRWQRPTVKSGSTLRTPMGVLHIESVDEVADFTHDEARRAGHDDRESQLEALASEGTLFRIQVAPGGEDPRIALRSAPVDEALLSRLRRMHARRTWTQATLAIIDDQPGVRAPVLAAQLGREAKAFKRDVRKLKELGLTLSLPVGYSLTDRGAGALEALE